MARVAPKSAISIRQRAAAKLAWVTIRKRKASGYYEKRAKKHEAQIEAISRKKHNAIELPKANKKPSAEQMMSATAALNVTFHAWGNRRKVSTSEIEVKADTKDKKADKDWLAVSKKLFDAKEVQEIVSLDGEIRRYIESVSLPGATMLKDGIYVLSNAVLNEVDEKLIEFAKQRKELAGKLSKRLSPLIDESRKRLGPLFNLTEYPTAAELVNAYRLTWFIQRFSTPANIEQELAERERIKLEAAWSETITAMQQALRANMAEFVDHLISKLTPDEKGNKKKFFDSSVSKLQEFCSMFDVRVSGIPGGIDNQLKTLVDRAKGLVKDADPDLLRSNDAARDYMRDGFQQIKKLLDPMVTLKPKRAIHLAKN